MNFLFVLTKNSIFDIPFALEHMGHTVTTFDHHPFDPVNLSHTEPLVPIEKALCSNQYDYVITYLFVPILSDLCEKYQIPYIAWIYDSPLISVFHNSILNSVNRIFVFDSAFYDRLIQIGIPNVYYMPLAANTHRINALQLTLEDQQKYSHDISFVGSLYENNSYNDMRNHFPSEVLVPMNHYLMRNLCNWHTRRSWPMLPARCTDYLTDPTKFDTTAITNFQMPPSMYLGILFLSRKLAEMERITALNTLAEDFDVHLYTGGKSDQIGILNVHPPVNYYTEIGKVYHFSKINLNFTLPSIETGVPLRIFDIMAYGGFVMSNYQEDFEKLFTPGKDIVLFHDLSEAKELAAYYLSHEEERKEIAANGYRTINHFYTYEMQLHKIIDICQNL